MMKLDVSPKVTQLASCGTGVPTLSDKLQSRYFQSSLGFRRGMGVWTRGFLRSVRLEDSVLGKTDAPTPLRESVGV